MDVRYRENLNVYIYIYTNSASEIPKHLFKELAILKNMSKTKVCIILPEWISVSAFHIAISLKPRINLLAKLKDEIIVGDSTKVCRNQPEHSTERGFLHVFILDVFKGRTPIIVKENITIWLKKTWWMPSTIVGRIGYKMEQFGCNRKDQDDQEWWLHPIFSRFVGWLRPKAGEEQDRCNPSFVLLFKDDIF